MKIIKNRKGKRYVVYKKRKYRLRTNMRTKDLMQGDVIRDLVKAVKNQTKKKEKKPVNNLLVTRRVQKRTKDVEKPYNNKVEGSVSGLPNLDASINKGEAVERMTLERSRRPYSYSTVDNPDNARTLGVSVSHNWRFIEEERKMKEEEKKAKEKLEEEKKKLKDDADKLKKKHDKTKLAIENEENRLKRDLELDQRYVADQKRYIEQGKVENNQELMKLGSDKTNIDEERKKIIRERDIEHAKYMNLKGQQDAMVTNIIRLKKEYGELEAEYGKLKKDADERERILRDTDAAYNEKAREYIKKEQEYEELYNDYERVFGDLEETQQLINDEQIVSKDLNDKIMKVEDELRREREGLEKIRKEKDKLEKDTERQQIEYNAVLGKLRGLEDDIQAYDHEIKDKFTEMNRKIDDTFNERLNKLGAKEIVKIVQDDFGEVDYEYKPAKKTEKYLEYLQGIEGYEDKLRSKWGLKRTEPVRMQNVKKKEKEPEAINSPIPEQSPTLKKTPKRSNKKPKDEEQEIQQPQFNQEQEIQQPQFDQEPKYDISGDNYTKKELEVMLKTEEGKAKLRYILKGSGERNLKKRTGELLDLINKHILKGQLGNGIQHGGAIGDSSGLWSDEIEKIMKPYEKKGYKGTFSIDELGQIPFNPNESQISFIMNTSPSYSQESGHWIPVMLTKDNIEYADSFADPPSKEFTKYLRPLINRWSPDKLLQFKINNVKKQNNLSNNCGYFAIKFIEDRYKGKDFKQATGFKIIEDSLEGEKQIKTFKKKLKQFTYI